jgi:chromosome condensin MukBEF MukE localization factor
MLSKALQKANTAVLLDNAANFEGAIEAYQDACELLQSVLLRSSGGDVEKYKLQEIV